MKADIIAIGNSKGIRIPKALLEQCGFNGSVDIAVEGKNLVIRPIRKVREGWEEAAKEIAARGEDKLEDWDFPNDADEDEWVW